MNLIDVLLALLIVAAIVLIFFIIKFLRDTTESIAKAVDSVSNMEKKIEELSENVSEALNNLTEISEKGVSLTHKIESTFESLEVAINRIKALFPSSSKEKTVTVENVEERANNLVATLKAFSSGFRTFFNTIKSK